MQGYNFTERVRHALSISREEAFRLGTEYVGCEHMLLGVIKEGQGVACAALRTLGIDLAQVVQRIEAVIPPGVAKPAGDLPYTSRAKKTLEFSMAEARELNHSYVGTEHLLLGIMREDKNIGAAILRDSGITVDALRAEILRMLGTGPDGEAQRSESAQPQGGKRTHAQLIDQHGLQPHPEGGHYRELYRSATMVREGERTRAAVTTIYYLLDGAEKSRWHVVASDEIWHFYEGGPLLLLDYDPVSKRLSQTRLGTAESSFVYTIPAGHWQAAVAVHTHCLMGCTVAPGFEFRDFQMVRDVAKHPEHFTGVMQIYSQLL